MKTIKAQLYVNKKVDEDHGKIICNKIDKEIEGWPIDYTSYQANLNNKDVMVFDIYIQANTFTDCDIFFSYMKRAIREYTYEVPHQLVKIKAEKIVGL